MKNYFQANAEHPYHLSVGAVAVNDKGEILVHHFVREDLPGNWPDLGINDFYILMRETIHPNETLEETLKRGLLEEFGVTADLVDYIGSIQGRYEIDGQQREKTTLYFLTKFLSQDVSKRSTEDIEGQSQLEWQAPEFLIPRMKAQAEKYNRGDIDESKILESLL